MKKPEEIKKLYLDKEVCKKVWYGTLKEANNHIEKLQRESTRDKVPVRAYLCPKCNVWHTTSWEMPDILLLFKILNEAVDKNNKQMENNYYEAVKVLSQANNTIVELTNKNKKLERELLLLKKSK